MPFGGSVGGGGGVGGNYYGRFGKRGSARHIVKPIIDKRKKAEDIVFDASSSIPAIPPPEILPTVMSAPAKVETPVSTPSSGQISIQPSEPSPPVRPEIEPPSRSELFKNKEVMLSIVTGTRNREHAFLKLFDSIVRNTDVPWEIVVGQVSEKPYECEKLLSREKVLFIPEHPPLGPARGYNACFRFARGAWVVWLNDDCVVEPGWASWAIRYMEKHPEVGIGAIYYAVNNPQSKYRISSWLGLPYANFGIARKEFGEKIGWFDEDIRFYGNDNSIALKCYAAGKTIHGLPGSRVLHYLFPDPQREVNLKFQGEDTSKIYERYRHKLEAMEKVYQESPNPFPSEIYSDFSAPTS